NNEMGQAKAHYEEALEIRRTLAEKNPDVYLPYVATTLNNLGNLLSDNNEMGQAKAHYEEALEIRRTLAEKNPRAFNLDVCRTAINMALFYKGLLEETGDMPFKASGITLMEDAKMRLSIYSSEHPTVIQYTQYIDYLIDFFSSFSKEQYLLNKRLKAVDPLKEENESETDFHQRVVRQQQVIDTLTLIAEDIPDNPELNNRIANEYGSLAWYQLFDRQFAAAEASARKGMEVDNTQEWINTNLALALLHQGKFEAAKEVYLKLKDKPYGEGTYLSVFLEDLDALEEEGITHPDVERVRALLRE
uniref:tetratricopeptide repeat protein n=1 Tax=Phaeodactylibacter xiamenensis TaxID=1524460 RepID=UPI0024A87E27